jgi:HAD superfamily hydrolase (TIGR01549 family)
MKLSGIKIIIWDFDSTLYPRNDNLSSDVREAELRVIMDHTGWNHDKAVEQFNSLFRRIYFSATQTAAQLSGIKFTQASIEMENYFDRTKYLKRDPKLIEMFTKLYPYKHVILSNGMISKIKIALNVLGMSPDFFDLIASSEITGTNKPDPEAYRYVCDKTGFLPENHLMVGDRDELDIKPAKDLGMKTCLVWGKSEIADFALTEVYGVPNILE